MSGAEHDAVVFEGLNVRLGQTSILEDVRARVPRHGCTVVVGPNGAGKTTLLLCLLGEVPFSGSLRLLSKDGTPHLDKKARQRLGYVPQSLQLDKGLPLSVAEFLSLGRQRRPLWLGLRPSAQNQASTLLRLVRAEHLKERRLSDLSGGELRRVLLAAALARDPEFLVLDEPAAGVDIQGERLFWEVLDAARRQHGFTQLMVSHNLPLAAHYATHVICLNKSVRAEGPPRSTLTSAVLLELFGVPIHLYPDQCDGKDPACAHCGALDGPDHTPRADLSENFCVSCARYHRPEAPCEPSASPKAKPGPVSAVDEAPHA